MVVSVAKAEPPGEAKGFGRSGEHQLVKFICVWRSGSWCNGSLLAKCKAVELICNVLLSRCHVH